MKKLTTLPPGLLTIWYRSQPEQVKTNVRRALGVFFSDDSKLNLSKEIISQHKK